MPSCQWSDGKRPGQQFGRIESFYNIPMQIVHLARTAGIQPLLKAVNLRGFHRFGRGDAHGIKTQIEGFCFDV